ncbi:TlpA family protein disulfide reductase [Bremerella cremea]|uniref:TlpA family protein disulfide reductase n=1 Tax=Bremerella cremea TaxID=1031537 RepID=A0A368KVR0_9BACT|nr:TlpA disulfide reductase family protein [Bremerella cremea]RCS52821.1 TlpA family protein disulfide reductase [Bremerella cremea]
MTRVSIATLMLLVTLGCAAEVRSEDDAKKPAAAAQPAQQAPAKATSALVGADDLKSFQADNSDLNKLVDFARKNLQAIDAVIEEAPDQAKVQVEAMRKALDELKIKGNQDAENIVGQIREALDLFSERIKLQRHSLEELKADVAKAPDDIDRIKRYTLKLMTGLSQSMDDDVNKIETTLKTEGKFIATTSEKATDSEAKLALKRAELILRSMESNVERLKSYEAVVGKPMLPIKADAWVNGKPLTTEELKGKVVLFDFWAIWCGPCIASFPHLVELEKKYGDEGFQVIGITQYYGFNWPEGADQPGQTEDGKVNAKEEQTALTKLTKRYELNYPTAVLEDSDEFYQYYAVSAIPHMVLVGRDGKVQKVSAGMSESVAKKLDEKIQELLKEPAPAK